MKKFGVNTISAAAQRGRRQRDTNDSVALCEKRHQYDSKTPKANASILQWLYCEMVSESPRLNRQRCSNRMAKDAAKINPTKRGQFENGVRSFGAKRTARDTTIASKR